MVDYEEVQVVVLNPSEVELVGFSNDFECRPFPLFEARKRFGKILHWCSRQQEPTLAGIRRRESHIDTAKSNCCVKSIEPKS